MSEITKVERVKATREGGNVERCHVIPHHGSYTVGKHSYDAVSLLLILHPDPSIAMVKSLMWHDAAERWVGDLPRPAKERNSILADQHQLEESRALHEWGLDEGFDDLRKEDYDWLHACDMLELWLWCLDQIAFGNHHAKNTRKYIVREIAKRWDNLPEPCRAFYENYEWSRLGESSN